MANLGNTTRPAYVYDAETDTWLPIGVGAHSHDYTSQFIGKTLVDAKGDIVTASASDTPAILSKGADGTVLVADSTASTGLRWGGGWTTFAGTWTNITIGNGTVVARYQIVGKTCNYEYSLTLGSTTSIGSVPFITLPATPKTIGGVVGMAIFNDTGSSQLLGWVINLSGANAYPASVGVGGTYALNGGYLTSSAPFTWTTNDSIIFRGSYEVA
jgi:hypothetical protein